MEEQNAPNINIFENKLVPKHEILTEQEKEQLLQKFNISLKQLPRIKEEDPAAKALGATRGDVLKITRLSETAGLYYHYRVVV